MSTMDMRFLTIAGVFLLTDTVSSNAADPCTSYELLPRAAYRGGDCPYVHGDHVCDRNLDPDAWYIALGLTGYLTMMETPADLLKCGTNFPIWMNGTHPSVADGEVERQTCQTTTDGTCFDTVTIKVKNCGSFYVYQLPPVGACDEAYCFGENDACPPYDDPCVYYEALPRAAYRGGQCPYEQGRDVCDRFLNPSAWYQIEGLAGYLTMQESPAGFMKCGTVFPIWLDGSHPAVPDGIVQRQTCQTTIDGTCTESGTINVRNCDKFHVYQLSAVGACPEAYCFGENEVCPPYDPCDPAEHSAKTYDIRFPHKCIGRSISCKISDESACDVIDNSAWYKFSGEAGYTTVAATCPSDTTCGTQSPLWISGIVAEYANGTKVNTVCVKDGEDCCALSFTVESKQCTGFMVYHFTQDVATPCRRFCTDDPSATCSTDHSGSNGFRGSEEKNSDRDDAWKIPVFVFIGICVGIGIGLLIAYAITRHRQKVEEKYRPTNALESNAKQTDEPNAMREKYTGTNCTDVATILHGDKSTPKLHYG